MKKQINPTIKAHLIRSAFYVILLLAVCVIPFALAQRNTTKRSAAKPKAGATLAAAGPRVAVSSTGAATAMDPARAKARQAPAATRLASRLNRRPAGAVCTDYTFTLDTATFVPGVDDIGNHGDDVGTPITLPFPVTIYDQTFTSATVGSNGHMTFGVAENGFGITCSPFGVSGSTYALGPYWGDQCTADCFNTTCPTCGIFTTTTGVAPDRVFYVEYRTTYYGLSGQNPDQLNYEIALYENGSPPFQFIYNNIEAAAIANDSELVVGVKKDDATFTQYGCDPSGGQVPPVSSGQALTASCAGGGTPTPTPTGTPGCTLSAWQAVANMPTDLYGAAGASDGTFFYAAGGYSFSQGTTLAVFNRFDPVANNWTPLTDMPQAAIEALAVYYPPTNKIYVFGGEDAVSAVNYNITRIYDIASGTWSTGANMPDIRSFMAGGYVPATGMIYAISGYNTGSVDSAQPTTWQYDPVADAWTDLTGTDPYPHAAGGFAYGVINNKLYVAGGRDAAINIINDTYEFDPTAPAGSRYVQKTDEPGTFQNNVPGSAAASGLLWVYGGGNPFVGNNVNKAASHSKAAFPLAFLKGVKDPNRPRTANSGRFYDPASDTWTNSPNMTEVRSFTSGAAIGENLIIAAGGYNGSTTVASAETEAVCAGGGTPTPTPTCTPGGNQWSEVASYPFAARGPFVVSDGTSYYIGGGYDGFDVHSDLMSYDPVANTYTPLANAPDPFFLSQAVIFNNKIYSIAGFNLGGQSTTTRIYDIAGNSWTTGAPIPEPNGLSDAATGVDSVGGKIYIACGFDGIGASNTLHIYDIATDSWTTGAPAPTALYLPGFGVINGKFYVASGNNGGTEIPDLQIYDIATNTWTTGAPIPTPVTGPGSAVFNGKLYVFGGTAPFPVTTTITQIYDPATDSWSTGPSMVAGKLWFYGGALDDSSILGPGGDDSTIFPTSDVQILAAGGCGSPTPTPTGTPGGCQFNVLIVSSDGDVNPVMLHDQIAAEPDVVTVDYFDAFLGTPTLGQLTPYNIVVSFSNTAYADPVAMGDVLADYADAGGTVVAFNFDWFGPPFGLDGRWITDGYTPFVAGGPINFNNSCLGTYDNTHPLMQGIDPGSLCAFFRHTLALTAGAVSVAEYQDAEHLCAYNVHNGHTGVGINAYVGDKAPEWSGPFGHVVVNAGRWLANCQGVTPTPTPTATATTTIPPISPTPTATATATLPPISPTPTATATATPSATRPPPTPRPRPTPFPRPTP
jgi:N-acetylneuraminic acid mutarotase